MLMRISEKEHKRCPAEIVLILNAKEVLFWVIESFQTVQGHNCS